eukprot:6203689-Pleurochrysis_carterae.AAC.2
MAHGRRRMLCQRKWACPRLVVAKLVAGLVGRELRNLVATTFETAYCLRSFPGGALFRTFPGLYSVWREDAAAKGGYVPTYAGMRRPSGDEIDELLEPPSVAGDDSGGKGASNFLDGFSKFVKGFQAM